ncbi:MAG: hypothetical protein ACYC8T_06595 [Myxococcaceae bacterium]
MKSYFCCWGFDSEYELTVDIYSERIVWLLELDPQSADYPRLVEQSHGDFLRSGPPRACAWGVGAPTLALITQDVRDLQAQSVGAEAE